jgi:hypothetical protein
MIRKVLPVLLIAAVVSGCAYTATDLHSLQLDPSLRSDPPKSVAFLALLVERNAPAPQSADSLLVAETLSFRLNETVPTNPLSHCIEIVRKTKSIPMSTSSFSGPKTTRREAITLLEAYSVCASDPSVLDLFGKQPTAFGKEKLLERKRTILDSLGVLLHAYVTESVEEHVGSKEVLGKMIGLEEAYRRLHEGGELDLFEQALQALESEGHVGIDLTRELGRFLGVDALLFVAVSYDYVQVLHADQYSAWYSIALRAETDARVYRSETGQRLARLQFSRSHDKHLYGLMDIGKLLSQGLRGKLKQAKPR